MENIPLQQRAGRNVGIEVMPPYLLGAAMKEIAINPTGVTVVMEGQKEVVRTPFIRVSQGGFGFVTNKNTDTYIFGIFFRDAENNEMKIGEITVAPDGPTGTASFLLMDPLWAQGSFLGLCEGEKIVIRSAIEQIQ